MDEQRLIDLGAGVEKAGPALGSPPPRLELVRERANTVNVTEQHPLGVNAEAPDHVRQSRKARQAHLRPQDACREARHPGAQEAARPARHRRGPNQLSAVLCQRRERARERSDHARFETGE
jgi:hypothetical protein